MTLCLFSLQLLPLVSAAALPHTEQHNGSVHLTDYGQVLCMCHIKSMCEPASHCLSAGYRPCVRTLTPIFFKSNRAPAHLSIPLQASMSLQDYLEPTTSCAKGQKPAGGRCASTTQGTHHFAFPNTQFFPACHVAFPYPRMTDLMTSPGNDLKHRGDRLQKRCACTISPTMH